MFVSTPAKPERIVRHKLPRARVVIPSPHVNQPVPIARNPILPHKRKRIRNPRADRRDLAEGIVAVLVDVRPRRIRDPDRRALEVVVVVVRRSARADLADQPQAIGEMSDQVPRTVELRRDVPQAEGIDQVVRRLAVGGRGDLVAEGIVEYENVPVGPLTPVN